MVLTKSTMVKLGTPAPSFSLPDTTRDGAIVSLDEIKDKKGYLVMFVCNHCPFVVHVATKLAEVCNRYQEMGFAVIAISVNDVSTHPADSPPRMAEFAAKYGWKFPYCYDESQESAKAYGAVATPDFYIYSAEKKLIYRGRFDDSTPGRGVCTGFDLEHALDLALVDEMLPEREQKPSIGCSIKWK